MERTGCDFGSCIRSDARAKKGDERSFASGVEKARREPRLVVDKGQKKKTATPRGGTWNVLVERKIAEGGKVL